MGIQDRDYMRRDGPEQRSGGERGRSTASRQRGSATDRRWLTQLMYWIFGALVLFVAAKYFIERRGSVPFPETGDVQWYSPQTQPRIARLTLRAPTGAAKSFVVRLSDWATGAPLAMIPVRAGETAVTLMPLGRYRMTISKGNLWMGSARMFGVLGESHEIVDPVEFYQRANQIFGVEIELERPFAGNMATQPVFRP